MRRGCALGAVVCALWLACACLTSRAHAQQQARAQPEAHAFTLGALELGFPYARASAGVADGIADRRLVAAEAEAQAQANVAAGYAGLRGELRPLRVRAGARLSLPLLHSPLPIQHAYDARALSTHFEKAKPYVGLELESLFEPALGPGRLQLLLGMTALVALPHDRYMFDENLHVIGAGVLLRARGGYLFELQGGRARIGPAAELVEIFRRKMQVVRAGVLAAFAITPQLEVLAQLLPVVASRDAIGLVGADFSQLGIRYHWPGPP